MNLQELREAVVRQSGRTDLVGFELDGDGIRIPDYEVDRGVDRFINQAIKTLSNVIKIHDNMRHYTTTVDATHAGIIIPGFLQAPKRGVSIDGTPIDWIMQQDIRGYYDTDTNHSGTPVWWFRISRNGAFLDPYTYEEDDVDKTYEVGVYPIPDKEYTLTVSCWTYVPLVDVEDENWWSIYEPQSVINLTCAEINTAELNGDRRVLDAALQEIKFNLLARDILEEEVHIGNVIG